MRVALPWLDAVVDTADTRLTSEIQRAMAKFATGTTVNSAGVHLSLGLAPAGPLPAPPDAVFQFVRGVTGEDRSVFQTPDGSEAAVDHRAGRIELRVREEVFTAPYSTWADLVAAPLAEHWRALRCYPLHAAAVSLGDEHWIVCGASGCGKTTLSLAVVASGGAWRADDKVLIRQGGDGLEAVSLYRTTNLAPGTIRRYPFLAFALDRAPIDETNDKRPCLLEELAVGVELSAFRPTAVLFPAPIAGSGSRLRRLAPADALLRLSAQSPVSGVRARLHAQHDRLAALARDCPAWEVGAGLDVLERPREFTGRLRDALSSMATARRSR
jgi:hypothetical protein